MRARSRSRRTSEPRARKPGESLPAQTFAPSGGRTATTEGTLALASQARKEEVLELARAQ